MSLDEDEDEEDEEEKKDVTRRNDRFFWKKVCRLDSNLSLPLPLLPLSSLTILLVEKALSFFEYCARSKTIYIH